MIFGELLKPRIDLPTRVLNKWRPSQIERSPVLTAMLVCCVMVSSVAFFFRHQISNGFAFLNGDPFDQVIEIAILEHWFNVFHGLSFWKEAGYFYPVNDTLGYNDGYFLFGCIYSVFREAGIDPFLSGELVNASLRVVAFVGFYIALRRITPINLYWALSAAALFTLSNNMFVQASHGQLFAMGLAPVIAILLHKMLASLRDGRSCQLILWGGSTAVLYAAWLLSAFYMAWFFAFYLLFAVISYVAIERKCALRRWLHLINRQKVPLGVLVMISLIAVLPFLSVYLPTAHETGMHTYNDAISYSPSLLDLLDVGQGNLLYGSLVSATNQLVRPGFPSFSERTCGFQPALLFLFGCGAVSLWRSRHSSAGEHDTMLLAFAIGAVLTWVLTVHIRWLSLWWYVYNLFPGAKTIRVIARYQISLSLPVIAIACSYLGKHSGRMPAAVIALLSGLLLLGEINTASTQNLDRSRELARLDAVPSPPSACGAFFVSNPPSPTSPGPAFNLYGHNIEAMIIAEVKHLPTLNGWATFTPTGWALVNPNSPSYLRSVHDFAKSHRVKGLCRLDLTTMQWSINPFSE